jgi:hypothetical protein
MHVTVGLIFVASLRKAWPMTVIAVRCPHDQSDQIVTRGKTVWGVHPRRLGQGCTGLRSTGEEVGETELRSHVERPRDPSADAGSSQLQA